MSDLADRIAAANADALDRLMRASPALVAVRPAAEVIPALRGRRLLHAGPPVPPSRMCGPMRGAAVGAILLDGWADSADDAAALLDGGGVEVACTHDHGAVGPMAGIISPSMPVCVVQDQDGGRAFCPLNEGVGTVLRFGAYGPAVLERLTWLRDVCAPALDAALRETGGLSLVPVMGRALTMGDEMHQRNVAATALLVRELAPALAGVAPAAVAREVLRFLAATDQFFLNVAMAACKCLTAHIADIPYCTLVTAMSRNGVDFGLRVSGLGDRWFTAPAPQARGLYFPGYGPEDANPDLGDSAIVETVGLGGFAMAAAPAVVGFVGLPSAREAESITRAMGEITAGRSPHWRIPALDFEGVPTGIDIRKVVALQIAPVINTGIAHRRAGVGQIGAGVVRAPLEAFQRALEAFAVRYGA
ncbi:MAG: DUF1116 domain-containing protein [Armatimonadota bacterium]|nr:DUF1116 domain-containing protein [Armatimonadota bacterium]MDR7401751.1 DUF1116 domain-containing protein [Armatimonadota bacterium]MDR7404143.1 DUF1116 domain-containing protein [Armatimonadota bacterium]MDR7436246.1 DUF1116 domain-containing protein [Armatimonadota bacterium]MDR7471374.1 DUF1116 domain-containing protein [Armatimonadota bacterium]